LIQENQSASVPVEISTASVDPTVSEGGLSEATTDELGAAMTPVEQAEPSAQIQATKDTAKSGTLDSAFQALKLQERFWARLNALATDAELSEELSVWVESQAATDAPPIEDLATPQPPQSINMEASSLPAAAAEVIAPVVETVKTSMATTTTVTDEIISVNPDAELAAQEIVIYEDTPEDTSVDISETSAGMEASTVATAQMAVNAQAQTVDEQPAKTDTSSVRLGDEQIPMPILFISQSELTAGNPVVVTIRLPGLAPRLYAKFWVSDRQTRTPIDGPHLIFDFAPNVLGDLEAKTQLTVPFDCLEMQFQAIAIEMTTQLESNRTIINRLVIPPDAPTVSLEEFDF
ncbi:MAG: hypothetical protein F6K19_18015, partial [Cyanothece sp. SIO1E1]|nr:hypothetical protein [Cyanothece sp. SIO1E1]